MSNRYTTREAVKAAMSAAAGRATDIAIDRLIDQVSRAVDAATHTWFIPRTDTVYLPFDRKHVRGAKLFFDQYLLAVTSLKDQGGARTLTEGTHFRLQPENEGPPYSWAEIILSQSSVFEAGASTNQRSFEVTGRHGAYEATVAAAQLGAAISTAGATTAQVLDGSKVGVGDTLLAGTEQLFVSERDSIDLGVNSAGALTKSDADQTVTLGDPTDDLCVGEVIRIGSERMLVTDVDSATSVQVTRAYDGTTLAAHTTNADIYVYRRFTVERGVNGTTAATHADDLALTRYVVPPEIEELVIGEVIAALQQQRAGWGRTVGGERPVELSGRALSALRVRNTAMRRRNLFESF